jgi:hypothetical protein
MRRAVVIAAMLAPWPLRPYPPIGPNDFAGPR